MGERRGRIKSRNSYEGLMDKDNGGGGLNVESGRLAGQGRVMGGNWG